MDAPITSPIKFIRSLFRMAKYRTIIYSDKG